MECIGGVDGFLFAKDARVFCRLASVALLEGNKHAACVVRGGKVLSIGRASLSGTTDICKHAVSRHAEMDAILRIRRNTRHKLHGSTVWSVRILSTEGEIVVAMAKPCSLCKKIMENHGVRSCVYSCRNGQFIRCRVSELNSTHTNGTMLARKVSWGPAMS